MSDEEKRHNVNESADKIRMDTKMKRGNGTRDQDTIDVSVRGDDPSEVVEDLNESLEELEETADTARGIQPDMTTEAISLAFDGDGCLEDIYDFEGLSVLNDVGEWEESDDGMEYLTLEVVRDD